MLHDEIAAGGMATVHLGLLMGPVGFTRAVAIKRLHGQFARDPDFVTMFVDEARLAARIQHPNVMPTLDVIATECEVFLVMQYVPGESLAQLRRLAIESGVPVPPRIAAAVVAATCHGLHAAHAARNERGEPLGIVHRDVSPQNLLLGTDGVTRVLDFGVAKASGRLQVITREGQLKGKLAYMAPEQFESGTASRSTDIYSVGVVFWELLTGQRLFNARNDGALLTAILRGGIAAPSTLVSGISSAVDSIVLRAVDRKASNRYSTGQELALAVERNVDTARTSEVAGWVETLAHRGIAHRAALLARIESEFLTGAGAPRRALAPSADRPARDREQPPSATHPTTVTPAAQGHARDRLQGSTSETPSAAHQRRLPPSGSIATADSRRILVIDDSEVMLSRIRQALEAEDYEVTTTTFAVGNGKHLPSTDLCIIDYHMPGIDGGTVIASLRRATNASAHSCAFYLYTSDPKIAADHKMLGFDGCFTDKGNSEGLVRQVNAVFRILRMRAIKNNS